jgi:hypothetical protein
MPTSVVLSQGAAGMGIFTAVGGFYSAACYHLPAIISQS